MTNAVFVDSGAFLALWNRQDQWHEAAKKALDSLILERARLLTTTFVFLECGNAAARTSFREHVVRTRTAMANSGDLIEPFPNEIDVAWSQFARGKSGGAGIVDQVSFAVMTRLGIRRALTNDGHFRAAGFETLF